MARLPTIDFTCWMDPKGYHLGETKPDRLLRVIRNGKGRDPLVVSHPLARTDALFRIFAKTATTPEGVLAFVQRHGPLTTYANDPGDIAAYVISHALNMQELLNSVLMHRRPQTLAGQFNIAPGASLDAAVVWDPMTKGPRWELRPSTLLDGLWLQFGEAITRGAHIRACAHCGEWFEAGLGTGRRLDAKFCSDEHRIAFNSLKRSKEN